jgi:hypothetical protein
VKLPNFDFHKCRTNKWQDEVREDGRIVGGEEWQEKVYDGEEWRKLLRTARNCRILHLTMEENRMLCTTAQDIIKTFWI